MSEMANAGEQEGDPTLLAESLRVLIPLGASRLHDARDAGVGQECGAVVKREEGIRGGNDVRSIVEQIA